MKRGCCIVLLCLFAGTLPAGCDKSRDSSPDEISKSRQEAKAPDDRPGGIVATLKNQTDHSRLEQPAEALPDSIEELFTLLARQRAEQQRSTDAQQQFVIQRKRAAASAKLLTLKPDPARRLEAVRIHLDALLRLISLGDGAARNEFHALASKLKRDPQQGIAQAVAVAGLFSDFAQRAQQKQTDLQPVIEGARRVAEKYSDSFEVCKQLAGLAENMLQSGHRDAWQELAAVIVGVYGNSSDETARKFAGQLRARVQVSLSNLDVIVNDIQQGTPGAFDQFRTAVAEILRGPEVTATTIEPILAALRWLENQGLANEALEANRIVMAASLNVKPDEIRTRLQRAGSLRETRLGLVGEPFLIEALSSRGNRFDWREFARDHVVAVVFWSPREPASVEAVRTLARMYETRSARGFRLLAVNLASDPDAGHLFGDDSPDWPIVSGNPTQADGPGKFVERYGIARAPQWLLVDRSGIVSAVNPPAGELASLIDSLIEAGQ